MSFERNREEIKERLITGKNIDWDYLDYLRQADRERDTDDYETAIHVLTDEGILTTNSFTINKKRSRGNYFVRDDFGGSYPRIGGISLYFTRKIHAEGFRYKFHPQDLVAKVVD